MVSAFFERCRVAAGVMTVALVVVAALCGGGCGYQTQAPFPVEVQNVAVPIFENHTFHRNIEFYLTEALIKELQLRTPYKVVDRDKSDTVIQGQIVAIQQTAIQRRVIGGVPEEMQLRVVADFQWIDTGSGQVLRSRQGLSAVGQFIPSQPVGELPQTGMREAAQRLAESIVATMRDDW